jgi:hypothetical protein
MRALTERTERLVDVLTSAILSTAEVAAERVELAAKVAQVQQCMRAFGAVLESVGAQKEVLLARLETATGPMKSLLLQQVEVLTAQEMAMLEKAGVAQPAARQALAVVDNGVASGTGGARGALYVRNGRRFARVDGVAGNGAANGNAGGHGKQ